MDLWHRLAAQSGENLDRTGISRKVLARLVASTGIGIGSSVLDIGCGRGELVLYFDSLGIQSVGIDESAAEVLKARRDVPHCDFYAASIDERLPVLGQRFDLVLMRQPSAYKGAIRSRAMFFVTSTLLDLVRPGGCLAFLAPLIGDGESGHRFGCYARHVARLTGRHELIEFPTTAAVARRLGWRSRDGAPGYGLVIVRPSPEPPDESVHVRPIRSAMDDATPCCEWAAQLAPAARVSKAA